MAMRFPAGRGVAIAAALVISAGWSVFIHREELADGKALRADLLVQAVLLVLAKKLGR